MAKQKPTVPKIRRPDSGFKAEDNPRFANIPTETEQPSAGDRVMAVGWEVVKTVGFIVLAAILIRAFVIQPFYVQGESMEPDFHDGDYLLVNQFSYHFSKPDRGDVVVFKAPPEPDTNYIKRIIGLPGETVDLKDGKFFISNEKHPQPTEVAESYTTGGPTQPESGQTHWQLASDQYFVVGDNREVGKSSDSRSWGPMPRANVIGKASLRVYPLDGLGRIKHQDFPNLSFNQIFSRSVALAIR